MWFSPIFGAYQLGVENTVPQFATGPVCAGTFCGNGPCLYISNNSAQSIPKAVTLAWPHW